MEVEGALSSHARTRDEHTMKRERTRSFKLVYVDLDGRWRSGGMDRGAESEMHKCIRGTPVAWPGIAGEQFPASGAT